MPKKKVQDLMIPDLQNNFSDCDPCSPHMSINQEFENATDDAMEEYHTFSKQQNSGSILNQVKSEQASTLNSKKDRSLYDNSDKPQKNVNTTIIKQKSKNIDTFKMQRAIVLKPISFNMKKSQVMIERYKANRRNVKRGDKIFQSHKTVAISNSVSKSDDQSTIIFN